MKKLWIGAVVWLTVLIGAMAGGALMSPSLVQAGTITQFNSDDTLSPTALNSNFNHIHGTMVGGHGARLTDSDVSPTAAISHSKLASPKLLPRAWVAIAANCAFPCLEVLNSASTGVSSISHTAVGRWTVTWSVARATTAYGVFIQPSYITDTPPPSLVLCGYSRVGAEFATTAINVACETRGGGALIDVPFTVLMMDQS